MRWIAGVGSNDLLHRWARLYVAQQRPDGRLDMLMQDGTMETVEENVTVDGAGIQLPYPALDAVFDALQQWKGLQSHQATEAKVLREWLAAERERVDRLIGRSGGG